MTLNELDISLLERHIIRENCKRKLQKNLALFGEPYL
jgi:hypothetical protein